MTPLKWFVSFCLLLLIVAGGVFFFSRHLPVESITTTFATSTASSIGTTFQQAPPMKRVMDLYELESKRVGRVDANPELTEKRLRDAAKELSSEEISWLGAQAFLGDMDSRFFATYLIGLSSSEASIATLGQIALTPIAKDKNERKMHEERALRMQAVEGISHGCQLPGAKDKLLEIISGHLDEGVRERAHRALYACQTGKKIEDADKAALEKLTSPER